MSTVRTIIILIVSLVSTTQALVMHRDAALFSAALLGASATRTVVKKVRQTCTNVGITSFIEDSPLLQNRTITMPIGSVTINVRKCAMRVALASLVCLAFAMAKKSTPIPASVALGIAAGSSMTLGS